MLPITSYEMQCAPPSNLAAARSADASQSGSFGDVMNRVQAESPDEDGPSTNVEVPSEKSNVVLGGEVTKAEPDSDAGQDAPLTQDSKPAAHLLSHPHTEIGSKLETKQKPGVTKPAHVGAKHEKQGGSAATGGTVGCLTAASTGVRAGEIPAADSPTGVSSAIAAAQPASAGALKKEGDATDGVAVAAAGRNAKADDTQAAVIDVWVSKLESTAVETLAGHDAVEAAKSEAAVAAERPAALESVLPFSVAGATGLERGVRANGISANSAATSNANIRSASGDVLTVQSYETSASNKLEIGVSGGSLGWLKVRAELGQGGEVHAFLRGASAGAESELRAQAGGLQAYLGLQQVGVHAVHVEASRTQSWSMTADSGGQRETGQQGSQAKGGVRQAPALFEPAMESNWMPLPQGLNGAGGWLNVLA